MKSYLYIFGRTPNLAFLELQTFLPDVVRMSDEAAKSTSLIDISLLGGTVKIAQVMEEIFVEVGSTFGVSVYGGPQLTIRELDQLKKKFRASRFVATKGEPLSSVVIAKNKLQEIILIKDKNLVARTLSVQDFEMWSKRDYGRPYSDAKSGMLPPKVARMIVNCAGKGYQKTLFDPFCGMGTVLAEGLLMGWNVVGADISSDVLAKTKKNLQWFTGEYPDLPVTYRLHVGDAVHSSGIIDAATIDAIVTEPYMGDTHVDARDVKNVVKGLEKLYIGCLRNWQKVLKAHGCVVIALPRFDIGGRQYFVKKVIDMCENLGYTIEKGPIEYGRPQAVVKRLFYIFRKV